MFNLKKIKKTLFYTLIISINILLLTSCQKLATSNNTKDNLIDINILSINDFHGQLETTSYINGKPVGTAPIVASYLLREKNQNPDTTVIVHAGDIVGASPPISALLNDEPTIKVLKAVGFDAGTLGNHEFDDGINEILRLVYGGFNLKTGYFEGANFPYICANVVYKKDNKTILPPSFIKKVKNIKLGFIGIVTKDTSSAVVKDYIKNVNFIDEVDAINKEAEKLKKQGANAVIVLAHEGGFHSYKTREIKGPIAEIAKKIKNVDVIISGHTHSYLNGKVNNKLIVQASHYGTHYAKVKLTFNKITHKLIKKTGKIIPTYQERIKPNKIVMKIINDAKSKVGKKVKEVITISQQQIKKQENYAGESELGNLIADAQKNTLKTDFALVNPGGIRTNLPKGEIKWEDAFNVQPHNNEIYKMQMTGKLIKFVLNQQFQKFYTRILKPAGFTFTYKPKNPYGHKIIELRKTDGTKIDDNKTYTVAVNNFLAFGGDGFTGFTKAKKLSGGPLDIDCLISYLKKLKKPLTGKIDGRIKKVTF